jgi:HEAT repeat protein
MDISDKEKSEARYLDLLREFAFHNVNQIWRFSVDHFGESFISRSTYYNHLKEASKGLTIESLQRFTEVLNKRGEASKKKIKFTEVLARLEFIPDESDIIDLFEKRETLRSELLHKESQQSLPWYPRKLIFESSSEKETAEEELLKSKTQYFLIKGDPGIGKSRILRRLAIGSLDTTDVNRLPICMDFNEIDVTACTLERRSIGYIFENYGISKEEFNSRDFIFLLDHLDQAKKDDDKEIRTFIDQRLGAKRNDKFYICCRTNFYRQYAHLEGRFEDVFIEELDRDAVWEIMRNQGIEKFSSRRDGGDRLEEFARNPLRLEILIELFEKREEEKRPLDITGEAEIYEEYVDFYINREAVVRDHQDIDITDKKAALSRLAFSMHDSLTPARMLKSYAEEILRGDTKNQLLLDQVKAEGLIVLSKDRSFYLFVHDVIREFFCALYLAKYADEGFTLNFLPDLLTDPKRCVVPQWEKVLIFYAGLAKNSQFLIDALLNPDHDDFFHTHFLLAARCLVESKSSSPKDIVKKMVTRILRYGSYWDHGQDEEEHEFDLRHGAYKEIEWVLPRLHTDDMVDELVAKMEEGIASRSREKYHSVLEYLTRVGSPKSVDILADLLRRSTEKEFQNEIIALDLDIEQEYHGEDPGEFQEGEYRSVIYRAVPNFQQDIVSKLLDIGSSYVGESLAPFLDSKYCDVIHDRMTILKNMGEFSSYPIMTALRKKLQSDDPEERYWAANSLFRIDPTSKEAFSTFQDLIQKAQKRQCSYGVEKIAYQAIGNLGHISTKDSVDILFQCFEKGKKSYLRSGATSALIRTCLGAYWGEEALIEYVRSRFGEIILIFKKEVNDRVGEVTRNATYTAIHALKEVLDFLGHIGTDDTIEVLTGLMKHRKKEVRAAAIEAMTGTESKELYKILWDYLEEEDFPFSVFSVLKSMDHERAIKDIVEILYDKSHPLRNCAIYFLGRYEIEEAADDIMSTVDDEDPEIRFEAIRALGETRALESASLLVERLHDTDRTVQFEAIKNLGELNVETAFNGLISVLELDDKELKLKAMEALDDLRPEAAVPSLISLISRPEDIEVKQKAIDLLGAIGSRGASTALRNELNQCDDLNFSLLEERDIYDWPRFLSELDQNAQKEAPHPAKSMWKLLPEITRSLIKGFVDGSPISDQDKSTIVTSLNLLLERKDFYQEPDYSGEDLPGEIQALLARNPSDLSPREVEWANRRLVEVACPQVASGGDPFRSNIIIALGAIGDEEAVEVLCRLYSDRPYDYRGKRNIIHALHAISRKRGVKITERMLKN